MNVPTRSENRRGFTLIEMVAVLVFLVAMTSGSLSLLIKLRDTQAASRASVRRMSEIRRFNHDLRRIAREATSAETVEARSGIVLSRDGVESKFRSSDDGQWIQLVVSDDALTRTAGRDRYWVGDDTETTWHVDDGQNGIVVEIDGRNPAVFRIECELKKQSSRSHRKQE